MPSILRSRRLRLLVLAPALLALAGCGDELRKSFGLGKNAPDEFQVVRRAPLSLPPDFSLRPPQPGAVRPQEGSATEQARRAVLEQSASATAAPRPADPGTPAAAPRTPVSMSVGGAVPRGPGAPRGTLAPEPAGMTSGEVALLREAGAEKSLPNIRSVISEELTKLAEAETRFIDSLLVWRDTKREAPATVLDAQKESQRLQENAALGKPVTDGASPTVKRRNKGIFDGIF
jgi:hypothetical protein